MTDSATARTLPPPINSLRPSAGPVWPALRGTRTLKPLTTSCTTAMTLDANTDVQLQTHVYTSAARVIGGDPNRTFSPATSTL